MTSAGPFGSLTGRDDVSRAWVDLASINDGTELAPLVARTLRIGEQSTRSPAEQVERYLSTRPGTLVFDNCKHVIDTVTEFVDRLLQACPGVRVLATSTQRLGLPDEYVYDLPPLDLPQPTQDLTQVLESECVRLLVQRIRCSRPRTGAGCADRSGVAVAADGRAGRRRGGLSATRDDPGLRR